MYYLNIPNWMLISIRVILCVILFILLIKIIKELAAIIKKWWNEHIEYYEDMDFYYEDHPLDNQRHKSDCEREREIVTDPRLTQEIQKSILSVYQYWLTSLIEACITDSPLTHLIYDITLPENQKKADKVLNNIKILNPSNVDLQALEDNIKLKEDFIKTFNHTDYFYHLSGIIARACLDEAKEENIPGTVLFGASSALTTFLGFIPIKTTPKDTKEHGGKEN